MGYGDKMHRCGKFMKYGLYISNFLILVGGVVATVVGIMALQDQSVFEKLMHDTLYKSASNVLVGTGICIMLFVVLGCFGAVKEIKCFLLLHIITLLIFFVVLFFGGVIAYVFHGKDSELIKTDMRNSMKHFNQSDSVQETWNTIQTQYQCCGIQQFSDWEISRHTNELPESCCRNKGEIPRCQLHINPEDVWTVGCLTRYKNGGITVGSVSMAVAVLMLNGLIFTLLVFRSIT